ncbi:MAG TPA: hypothetical protein VGP05_20595 [Pseudonocardia sp.]|nr:hypothetical protein [Pseudonocardia sp.]
MLASYRAGVGPVAPDVREVLRHLLGGAVGVAGEHRVEQPEVLQRGGDELAIP